VFELFPGNYAWSQAALRAMFVGGSPGDVLEAVDRLAGFVGDDIEAWFGVWNGIGRRLEDRGRRQLAHGHRVSAADTLRRASVYLQWSCAFLPPRDERRRDTHQRSIELFGLAGEVGAPHARRIEVDYEGRQFPAWLVLPDGSKPAPCVIYLPGWDSTKEQGFGLARALAERGIATLLCDGPGIGEAVLFRGMPNRYDYEVPGRAAYERLLRETDLIDIDRIGVVGSSLGGYRAARFAAFEPRLQAAVVWGAIWDFGRAWRRQIAKPGSSLPTRDDHALHVMGVETLEAVTQALARWTLEGVASQIRCPLLILHGERDSQIPLEDAQRLHDAASSQQKVLRIFTSEEGGSAHCQNDNRVLAHEEIGDWLMDVL